MQNAPATMPLDVDEFLCFAAYSASHAFSRIYKPLLDQIGLTYPQYLVMVLLWNRDGQKVGELGQKLFLESNTLTPLLKRLEMLGYIMRRRDAVDERQVCIFLTDTGRALREAAVHVPDCILAASGLSVADAKEMLARIKSLRASLRSHFSREPVRARTQ